MVVGPVSASAPPGGESGDPGQAECGRRHAGRYTLDVVIFFEVLLVLCSVLITWFGLYVLYRLVTDES